MAPKGKTKAPTPTETNIDTLEAVLKILFEDEDYEKAKKIAGGCGMVKADEVFVPTKKSTEFQVVPGEAEGAKESKESKSEKRIAAMKKAPEFVQEKWAQINNLNKTGAHKKRHEFLEGWLGDPKWEDDYFRQ